jgi:hypothetical protein
MLTAMGDGHDLPRLVRAWRCGGGLLRDRRRSLRCSESRNHAEKD